MERRGGYCVSGTMIYMADEEGPCMAVRVLPRARLRGTSATEPRAGWGMGSPGGHVAQHGELQPD